MILLSKTALEDWPIVEAVLTAEYQPFASLRKTVPLGLARLRNALAWAENTQRVDIALRSVNGRTDKIRSHYRRRPHA